jgi:Tfp pilus assembly pilus retraction ATPase PilT
MLTIEHSLCMTHNRWEMPLPSLRVPPEKFEGVLDYNTKEFTFYEPYGGPIARGFASSIKRADCSAEFEGQLGESKGRAIVCSCFQRRRWSLTVRRITKEGSGKVTLQARSKVQFASGYLPQKARGEFLSTIDESCATLRDVIFTSDRARKGTLDRKDGLIIVAGSTNAGKSMYVRGLIHHYLAGRLASEPDRNPHLITIEDPIEAEFSAPNDGISSTGVDYTPRQLGIDVASVEDGITDALRQTPEMLYVGEIRDDRQWKEILHFASTGHLAITTTHAGSLQETMRRVFLATEVRTAADRSAVASRIAAIVHLRHCRLGGNSEVKQACLPSVWRSTSQGLMQMMECGLSSIVSGWCGTGTALPPPDTSCIGRAWFAEKLVDLYWKGSTDKQKKAHAAVLAGLINEAAGWDLQGS